MAAVAKSQTSVTLYVDQGYTSLATITGIDWSFGVMTGPWIAFHLPIFPLPTPIKVITYGPGSITVTRTTVNAQPGENNVAIKVPPPLIPTSKDAPVITSAE